MAHKQVFELGTEERKYVEQAIKSGTLSHEMIALIVLVGRLLDRPPSEIQSKLMDCRVGVQQVWGELYRAGGYLKEAKE